MSKGAREFVFLPNAAEEGRAFVGALVSALTTRPVTHQPPPRPQPRVMVWPGFLGQLAPWLLTPLKRGIGEAGFTVVNPPLGFWQINFTRLAHNLNNLLRAVEDADIQGSVGHSMGGLISLLLAERLGIVGVSIGSPVRGTPWWLLGFVVGLFTGLDLNDLEVRALQRRVLANASEDELIVWGRGDQIARRKRCTIPGARMTSKPGGHIGVVGHERTVRAVVDHLRERIFVAQRTH